MSLPPPPLLLISNHTERQKLLHSLLPKNAWTVQPSLEEPLQILKSLPRNCLPWPTPCNQEENLWDRHWPYHPEKNYPKKQAFLPRHQCLRMALIKGYQASVQHPQHPLLVMQSALALGRRLLWPTIETTWTEKSVEKTLRQLSGRSHRTYTSLCLYVPTPLGNKLWCKTVESRLSLKNLSDGEIQQWLSERSWEKQMLYDPQGRFRFFMRQHQGSFSSVLGAPEHAVYQMLQGAGWL